MGTRRLLFLLAAALLAACGGNVPIGDADGGDGGAVVASDMDGGGGDVVVGDADGGDAPIPTTPFACGPLTCEPGTYCLDEYFGGFNPPDTYTCNPFPSGCTSTPTCDCLSHGAFCGFAQCRADTDGHMTVHCEAP